MNGTQRVRGAGGTAGGMLEFGLGFVMACAGAYLLTSRVTVSSGYWSVWGQSAFGLTLMPLLFGIGLIFFNGRSVLGWLLAVGGASIILAGILLNLQIYFQPTSLYATLLMLTLLAGGLGLVARAVRPH